jgi:hypothetical protein
VNGVQGKRAVLGVFGLLLSASLSFLSFFLVLGSRSYVVWVCEQEGVSQQQLLHALKEFENGKVTRKRKRCKTKCRS